MHRHAGRIGTLAFGMPNKPWTAAEFDRVDSLNKPMWIALAQELNIALE